MSFSEIFMLAGIMFAAAYLGRIMPVPWVVVHPTLHIRLWPWPIKCWLERDKHLSAGEGDE